MPGMRTAGPACCCCKDIWPQTRSKMKVETPRVFEWAATGTSAGEGDFDHVARKDVYANMNGSASFDVYIHDDRENTETLVINRALSTVIYGHEVQIASDPDEQRIVTVCKQTSGADEKLVAHVVDYDGTNDTPLFSLPVLQAPDRHSKLRPIHYNRATQTVLGWLHRGSITGPLPGDLSATQTFYDLVEFDLLGNPPNTLHTVAAKRYSLAGDQYILHQPPLIEIDYTNAKIWWMLSELDADPGANFVRKIQRSNYDGSNVETLEEVTITLFTAIYAGWQWSHKDGCFYLSTYDPNTTQSADENEGFWKVSADWTERELLYSRKDLAVTPAWFRLGCGYETLGPSSPA